MPSHGSVVFTPLEYSTGRVIYEAEDTDSTQRTSGYGTFKSSSFSRSVADLHQEKPRISIFHLNLDNTASDSDRQSKLPPYSSPQRSMRARNRTMSCDHLTKVVETVRSARVPKITIPCAQAVRNIVKCKTPNSSSTTEPHFEIVTPLIYVPVDAKMVDDDDEDARRALATETETPHATFFPRYPEPMPVPQSAPPSMSWSRMEKNSIQPLKAKEKSNSSSLPPEREREREKEGSLSDQSDPDLVPIPSSAPPVVFMNQTPFPSGSDPIPSPDPRPTTLKKPRPLPVPPVLSTSTTGNKIGKPRRLKRPGGVDVHRELPPLPTA